MIIIPKQIKQQRLAQYTLHTDNDDEKRAKETGKASASKAKVETMDTDNQNLPGFNEVQTSVPVGIMNKV